MSFEKSEFSLESLNNINFIDYNEKFNKLVETVQILDGKIYGDFISQYYFQNNIFNKDSEENFDNNSDKNNILIDINFKEINIIFKNYNDRICFIRLIQTFFEMYKNYNSNEIAKINLSNYHILINYNYLNKNYSKIININVYNNVLFIDLNLHISFIDINLLSLNNEGLNLIKYNSNKKSFISKIDNIDIDTNYSKFNKILNRVINKKFSFIENYNINIFKNIDNCIDLILNGWIMDDFHLKDETSVLFLWKNINKNIRTSFNKNDIEKMKNYNTCSICTSKFKDTDLIINTKCNHNFHWDCNNFNSGIKNWILKFSHKCPICRFDYCI
tara:strand:+ start:217 stop:1206 length:990 start_codon:yes stop_codon:yes gene_type:complete